MPEADFGLAEAPAEQDGLALPLRGEVDEPLIEILDERTRFVDPRHAARDACHGFVQPLLHLLELTRLEVAPVARDPGRQLRLLLLKRGERTPVLDELLDVRKPYEERITFVHVDIFKSLKSPEQSPTVIAWNLPTEPWLFTVGGAGTVVGRLDTAFGRDEMQGALDDLLTT